MRQSQWTQIGWTFGPVPPGGPLLTICPWCVAVALCALASLILVVQILTREAVTAS